jgi:DNA-binding XRE family transcriptional regulator
MPAIHVSGSQLRAARVLLHIQQQQLAEALGVHRDTIRRCEADRPGTERTRVALIGLLRRNGALFSPDGGVRLAIAAQVEYREWLHRWS